MSSSSTINESSSSTNWRVLLEKSVALSRQIRGSNYVHLATVDGDEPRARTIVFRGFLNSLPPEHPCSHILGNHSCLLQFCTDARSAKASQSKVAEIVWWFPQSNEQFRLRGTLKLVGADEPDADLQRARTDMWESLRDASRHSFYRPGVPGEAYSDSRASARDSDGIMLPPNENFLLVFLDPTHTDYLSLTGEQYRQMDTRNKETGEWFHERVNP